MSSQEATLQWTWRWPAATWRTQSRSRTLRNVIPMTWCQNRDMWWTPLCAGRPLSVILLDRSSVQRESKILEQSGPVSRQWSKKVSSNPNTRLLLLLLLLLLAARFFQHRLKLVYFSRFLLHIRLVFSCGNSQSRTYYCTYYCRASSLTYSDDVIKSAVVLWCSKK